MRSVINSWFVFLCLFGSHLQASEYQLTSQLTSYSYSEPTSIDSFMNDFHGDYQPGDHAVTYNQFEVGAIWQNFSLSYVRRIENFYAFSQDFSRFYYQLSNDNATNRQQNYQLYLKTNSFDAQGMKLGYRWEVSPRFAVKGAITYLTSDDFYQGTLSGTASWLDNDDIQVDAPAMLYSQRNRLLENPVADANGEGGALDISIDWQLSNRLMLNIQAKDLWSELRWKNALYSQINRWQVYELDENSQLDTRPILQGRFLNYKQTLVKKWLANTKYQLNDKLALLAQVFHTDYFTHYHVGASVNVSSVSAFSLAWHEKINAVEIGYQNQYGYLRLMADSLDRKKAHAFGLSTGFAWSF